MNLSSVVTTTYVVSWLTRVGSELGKYAIDVCISDDMVSTVSAAASTAGNQPFFVFILLVHQFHSLSRSCFDLPTQKIELLWA